MLLPEDRTPTHPGEILSREFLAPLGISQVALAAHIGVPVQRVNELVRGKRGVTPETAWLLAQAFETTPDFWLNLQAAYDLARTRPERTIPSAQVGELKPAGRAGQQAGRPVVRGGTWPPHWASVHRPSASSLWRRQDDLDRLAP